MAIKHVTTKHYKENIEIKTKKLNDTSVTTEQKQVIQQELNELKDIHNEHVNFHVKKDEEKIDAMPDGEEKKEAKVKLEDFKSNYVLEANSTENASKTGGRTESKKSNTASKKDSNTSTKSNATKTSSTKSSSSESKKTNSTPSKKNTDDSNSNYTAPKTEKLTEAEIKEYTQTCIQYMDKLITLYNSNKMDELRKFDKQSQSNDTQVIEDKNHCEATKFAEVYGDLKGEIHKLATEHSRNKKSTIKEEIKKIIKNYMELKKSTANSGTENDKANTTDSSKTPQNKDDSGTENVSKTAKEVINYYYNPTDKKYTACPGQDLELIKSYNIGNYYDHYYDTKSKNYLNASDKFYTDSTCKTEINRNITKIYREDGEFKACADQGLTLYGTTKADVYTSLKALYYDDTNSKSFTQKNTELYTDSSCKNQIIIDKEAKTKIYKEDGDFKACADQGLTLYGTTKADVYTSLKALYYDNTKSKDLTPDNTELYTDSSCKELAISDDTTDNSINMDSV